MGLGLPGRWNSELSRDDRIFFVSLRLVFHHCLFLKDLFFYFMQEIVRMNMSHFQAVFVPERKNFTIL